MKARALATYRMGQQLIRRGDIFEADDDYIRAMVRNGLAQHADDDTADNAPRKRKAKAGRQVPGKTVEAPAAGTGEGVQLPPPAGGEALPPVETAPAAAAPAETAPAEIPPAEKAPAEAPPVEAAKTPAPPEGSEEFTEDALPGFRGPTEAASTQPPPAAGAKPAPGKGKK
jgi:hypothetical protein